jgi:hypothetical protein
MNPRRLLALPVVLALVVPTITLSGCGVADDGEEEFGGRSRRNGRVSDASERLGQAGAWKLPASVKAAGEAQYVGYDSPPAWNGGKNCTGTFTKGAAKLKQHLLGKYSGISSIGGYDCRQNTANKSETSVHGTGRALDIMIPKSKGDADNTVGDEIANWLVVNAEDIGVQFIIWDHTKWNASYSSNKAKPYTGPIPHIDHIHVELDNDGAAMKTAWFQGNHDDGGGALPDTDTADSGDTGDTGGTDTGSGNVDTGSGNVDSGNNGNNGNNGDHANDDAADGASTPASGCGDVTEAGVCDGNTLQFCDGGELIAAPCGSGTTCGDDYPGSGYKVCNPSGAGAGSDSGSNEPASDPSDTPSDNGGGNQPDAGDPGDGDINLGPAPAGGGCGFVTDIGLCAGGQLMYCSGGAITTVDCQAQGQGCGFDVMNLWFDCL